MHPKRYLRKKELEKKEALKAISSLFEEAVGSFAKNPKQAHQSIKKLRRIALKYRFSLPPHIKRRICKHCHHFLVPGINVRVRTRKKQVIYHCLDCKHFMRFGFGER